MEKATQCRGVTESGERCRLKTKDPSGLCHKHKKNSGKSKPAKQAGKRSGEKSSEELTDKRSLYPKTGDLGKGTYGQVYITRDSSGIKRAVKKFLKDTPDRVRGVEGIRELDVLLRLKHPYIISPVDFYFPTKRPLEVVLPLGKDFSSEEVLALLQDERKAATFCFQISSALLFLHKNNLYHCDIKPGNILLVPSETGREKIGGVAKLADFGIVKYITSNHSKTLCNSPKYDPPEPKKVREVPHSEMWALGCFFFYCLSKGKNFYDSLASKTAFSLVPPEWRPLLRQMLDPDPATRISTVEEVLLFPRFAFFGLRRPTQGMILESVVPYGKEASSLLAKAQLPSNFLRQAMAYLEYISFEYETFLSVHCLALDLIFRGALLWPEIGEGKRDSLPLVMSSYIMAQEIYEESWDFRDLEKIFPSGKGKTSARAAATEGRLLVRRFLRALEGRVGGTTIFTASPSLPVILRCLVRIRAKPEDYLALGPIKLALAAAESGAEAKQRAEKKTWPKDVLYERVVNALRAAEKKK